MKKILFVFIIFCISISYSQESSNRFYYDIGIKTNYFSVPAKAAVFSPGFYNNIGLLRSEKFCFFGGYGFESFSLKNTDIALNSYTFNIGGKGYVGEIGYFSLTYLNYVNKSISYPITNNNFIDANYNFNLSVGYGFVMKLSKVKLNLGFNVGFDDISRDEYGPNIVARNVSFLAPTYGVSLFISN